MGVKRVLKLTLSLVFIIAAAVFCLSGNKEAKAGETDYLIGSAKIELSSGRHSADAKQLSTTVTAQDLALLDCFPRLQYADFSGSVCYNEIAAWAAANPQVEVKYTIPLPNGSSVDSQIESLDLAWLTDKDLQATAGMLGYLPQLKNVTLGALGGDSLDLAALSELSKAAPGADFEFDVEIMGKAISSDAESIDLSALSHADAADTAAVLSCMTKLKSVDLGSQSSGRDLQWQDIALLKAARPDAKFNYSFELYGQSVTLDTETLDFRGVSIEDKAEMLYSVLPCMNNCSYLDMDSTGVESEVLADLSRLFPETEIVWRVWFGENYSVRTDVERILASKPTVGGTVTDTTPLKYCTKVKYLDIGHNYELADFSFVANMPELEVAIIAMTAITDISGLANCPKLEYLELNSTNITDISCLEKATALRHLNIASCPELKDMSPIFGLSELERLWIGKNTPIPAEQIEQMRGIAPACTINTTVSNDPTGEHWRYTGYDPDIPLYYWVDRYELLREQLGYNYQEYSFYWLDPLCELEAPAQHAGKYGKEVYGL